VQLIKRSFPGLKHIELGRKVIHSIKRLQKEAIRELLVPSKSQRARSPHCILNLPSIDLSCGQLGQLVIRDSAIFSAHLDVDFCQEGSPHLGFCVDRKLLEVERDVCPGAESFVDCFNPVCGQE
jgi:hypothetical protein